jgi:hypothetical protein
MNKKIHFFVLLLCLCPLLTPQTLELPEDDFITGWKRQEKAQRFVRANLFDYIDGGADLFLEMGFEELTVQRYKYENTEIGVESYRMDTPEAGLGIYLMKCGIETPHPGIDARNSTDRFQIVFVKNNHFIMLNNFQGKEELIPVLVETANRILQTIPEGEAVTLFSSLPEENRIEGSGRIIRGPYSLQSLYTFGEGDILQLGDRIFGIAARYREAGNGDFIHILIPYPDSDAAKQAFMNLISNLDPYLTMLQKDGKSLLFEDYKDEFGFVRLDQNVLDIKVNLEKKPGDHF